jgi:hypothetical protein
MERPRITPAHIGAWAVELVRVAPGLVEAHLPGWGGLDAGTRERLILTVADAAGSRFVGWVHDGWHQFLGPTEPDERTAPLIDFARASAEGGAPLDATTLEAVYPASVVRATRATVARAELSSLVARTPALPVLLPMAVVAGALRVAVRLAPAVPEPELPPDSDANLVVHLVAEALPTYLANALVRAVLLWNPLVLAVAVRMEGTGATLRIGQGRARIVNGVQDDAIIVVEDGLEPLLHVAAGSILRQLARVPAR